VTSVLLRHASAGHRHRWEVDDQLRPLDARGRRQAVALVELLRPLDVRRVLSSPYVRCIETVQPLAAALGIEVECRDELAEETPADRARALIGELGATPAVLCTHGDLTTALLGGHYLRKGHAAVLDPARGLQPVEFLTS